MVCAQSSLNYFSIMFPFYREQQIDRFEVVPVRPAMMTGSV